MRYFSIPSHRSIRNLLIVSAVGLASITGVAGTASAEVLSPAQDMGASGNGIGLGFLEDGPATASYEDLLAGSGYEHVAITQESATNAASGGEEFASDSYDDLLAGSGYESAAINPSADVSQANRQSVFVL